MGDRLKPIHAIGDGRANNGGARPNSGPYGLHDRITAEELETACALIRTGRATLEAAIVSQRATTHPSIYRSRRAGIDAIEKQERGEELTESERCAARFFTAISGALAAREIILTRQALGDGMVLIGEMEDPETGHMVKQYASPKQAEQALKVLQLTCKHWTPKTQVETEITGTLTTQTPDMAAMAAELAALHERERELTEKIGDGG